MPIWNQSALKQQNSKPFKTGIYKGNANTDSPVPTLPGITLIPKAYCLNFIERDYSVVKQHTSCWSMFQLLFIFFKVHF